MKKTLLFPLIITSFLFGQENQIQTQTKIEEQSAFEKPLEIQEATTTSINSLQAYEKMKVQKDFFIIDIRSPEKNAISGSINKTKLHIAYEVFDNTNYTFKDNKYFYDELKYEITSKSIPFNKDIYIFDNYSDSISLKVGEFLNELGYLNVYAIKDGFEGSKARYGKFKNQRVVNGWKNRTNEWNLSSNFKNYWSPCKYSFLFEDIDKQACEAKATAQY